MLTKTAQNNISKLSPKLQLELYRFIDLLLNKQEHTDTSKSKFSFDWEGGLCELKDKYNSVELQHKANMWR
jgi:hypothetical protein